MSRLRKRGKDAVRKAAIFVEGLTEQVFAQLLMKEVAGERNIDVESMKLTGGTANRKRLVTLRLRSKASAATYYVLIVDSGTDNRVISDVRENYDRLISCGFSHILAIRDVYPLPRADVPNIERMTKYRICTKPVDPDVILAVMEVEAWFVAEYTHFGRVDPTLTPARVASALGLDVTNLDAESLDHPAETLDTIYQLAGKRYQKARRRIQRTVEALDYAVIYLDAWSRAPRMKGLIDSIDRFLS
jgi:hypothetical protein